MAVDLSTGTIRELFLKQMKELTLNQRMESFDMQFGDLWL